ncbi:hypothetical protein F070042J6_30930 [Bacteroides sp. f07]
MTPVHREDGKNLNFTHSLFLSLGKEQKSSVQSTLLSSDGSGKAFYGEYVNARYA